MKRTGGWRAAILGVTGVLAAMTALAGPAGATDDLDGYQGEKKNATVQTDRDHDETTRQTTFTFTLATNGENVSHVLLVTCPEVDIISVTGPDGADKKNDSPETDPSLEHEHTGIKFEPGAPGTYTIVFAGNIAGAEFVVKDGTGHKHWTAGSNACQAAAPQTPETPTNEPPADNPPAGNPPAENPPGNQPGPNPEVQGAQATNDQPAGSGTEVLGAQVTQPEVQGATLPRTGAALPLLAPIGAVLVAFGGLVTAIGRRV